jgi:hypothetical protein
MGGDGVAFMIFICFVPFPMFSSPLLYGRILMFLYSHVKDSVLFTMSVMNPHPSSLTKPIGILIPSSFLDE